MAKAVTPAEDSAGLVVEIALVAVGIQPPAPTQPTTARGIPPTGRASSSFASALPPAGLSQVAAQPAPGHHCPECDEYWRPGVAPKYGICPHCKKAGKGEVQLRDGLPIILEHGAADVGGAAEAEQLLKAIDASRATAMREEQEQVAAAMEASRATAACVEEKQLAAATSSSCVDAPQSASSSSSLQEKENPLCF